MKLPWRKKKDFETLGVYDMNAFLVNLFIEKYADSRSFKKVSENFTHYKYSPLEGSIEFIKEVD